jgi:hypothetical protein
MKLNLVHLGLMGNNFSHFDENAKFLNFHTVSLSQKA